MLNVVTVVYLKLGESRLIYNHISISTRTAYSANC